MAFDQRSHTIHAKPPPASRLSSTSLERQAIDHAPTRPARGGDAENVDARVSDAAESEAQHPPRWHFEFVLVGRVIQAGPESFGPERRCGQAARHRGPHHRHPTGGICMVMPITPGARFDAHSLPTNACSRKSKRRCAPLLRGQDSADGDEHTTRKPMRLNRLSGLYQSRLAERALPR